MRVLYSIAVTQRTEHGRCYNLDFFIYTDKFQLKLATVLFIFLKYCEHNNYLSLHSICSLQCTIQEIDNLKCPSKTYR